MNRTTIINKLFNMYGFNTYLEIGVRDTKENFDLIVAKNKDGVDPAPITPVKFRMTSDEFFEKHANQKYDVIFVDGLHTKGQVYKDVINSIEYLNDGGFIVMHDCNPPTEYHTRSYDEYLKTRGEWNGDVFEGFIKLKKELRDWNCFVVNKDFGCGIITQRTIKRKFPALDVYAEPITWKYFNFYRKELLDLITYEEYIKLF